MLKVGVISDTHGLLRPQALDALRGSEMIVHAGDVGGPEILSALAEIAPVHAVRGNVDIGGWADALPFTDTLAAGDAIVHILHIREEIALDPIAAGFSAVIFGHSHQPSIEHRRGVLWLNPGSAGPRRFSLPVTVARLVITGSDLEAEIIELR